MNRLSLVLTYISGQVLIFWQEGQKVYKLILQFWDFVYKHIARKNPKSLKTCVLLDKPSRRQVEFVPDYIGFTIEDKFVVGYGFDFEDMYRNVPYIFNVTDEPL